MPRVELFASARLIAGFHFLEVPEATIAEVLAALAAQCPALIGSVLDATGRPTVAYSLNLNGVQFVADLSTRLMADDTLLLMSSLSGG